MKKVFGLICALFPVLAVGLSFLLQAWGYNSPVVLIVSCGLGFGIPVYILFILSSRADQRKLEAVEASLHSVNEQKEILFNEISQLTNTEINTCDEAVSVLKDYNIEAEIEEISDESEVGELIGKQLARSMYYFKKSIPVVENMSTRTREFEVRNLRTVFERFERIWAESEEIVKDSERSMSSIFDDTSDENLAYVLTSSRHINNEFSEFVPILKGMGQVADQFMKTAVSSFESIAETTKEIEELAEQVKIISINVRIEAARIKGESAGFKVLGQDITGFADQTTHFAKATSEQISATMGVVKDLKKDLTDRLSTVRKMVESMYERITPFEGILEKSSGKLKDVINQLHGVSDELSKNVKSTIGNLQYQDVSSQESEHVLHFLKVIQDNCATVDKSVMNYLDEDLKKEIHEHMIQILLDVSTTGNEVEMIEAFAKEWGVKMPEEVDVEYEKIDDSTFLF